MKAAEYGHDAVNRCDRIHIFRLGIAKIEPAGWGAMFATHEAPPTPASVPTTMSDQARTVRRDGFRADIQGLRAIAVGSVVLYHAGITFVSGGYVGVDIFFVISGFLITSHLLRDVLSTGRVAFGSFYARRVRRILPASFVVNVLTLIAALLFIPTTELAGVGRDAIATALYVPNMAFAGRATDYLAQSGPPSLYQHFWSLGVEEQFYLLWPLLLVGVFALARGSRRLLGTVIVAVAAVSFVACVWLTKMNEPWAFFSLPTRAWEFSVGGLVALVLAGDWRLPRIPAALTVLAGLTGLGVAIFVFSDATVFPGSAAALPVLATAAVILGGASSADAKQGPPASRLLGVRPMVFVGEISYSLYLVHWPIFTIARYANGQNEPLSLAYRLALLVASVPVAYLLYRLVENPVRRSRRLAALRPSRTLLSASAFSVVVVLVAIATVVATSAATISTNRAAPHMVARPNPKGTSYVPSNLQPTLAGATDDNPASYADGCHLAPKYTAIPPNCVFGTNASAPLVVLWGDSHAAEWFPALKPLADEGLIRLESDTKSGCPSADLDVDYRDGTGPQPYPECPVWRQVVLDRLTAAPPALVIMSNYNHPDLPQGGFPTPAAWSSAISRTITAIPSQTSVVVLGETPLPDTTPADCLAANISNTSACDLVRSKALVPAMVKAERTASQTPKSQYVDLSNYLCNSTTCPPIIGNVLVYRDSQHLTATFAKAMSAVVDQQIELALARH